MNAPVSAILDRKGHAVYSVASNMTVAEAVAKMNSHRIGSVLVFDGGQLVGIFTERDVLRRVVGPSLNPQQIRVCDVMTNNVETISPEFSIEDAMELFTEKRFRHLPVVQEGRVIGTISIGDVTRWVSDLHRVEAEHLKSYIGGGFAL